MTDITVTPIRDDLSFGARVAGVTLDRLADADVRAQLGDAFEQRGLLIFEDVEPTPEMQVAISTVFGPLKDHPSYGDATGRRHARRHRDPPRARTRAAWSSSTAGCCRSGCRGTSTTATTTSSTGPACSAPSRSRRTGA